jgi:hypothetical protein
MYVFHSHLVKQIGCLSPKRAVCRSCAAPTVCRAECHQITNAIGRVPADIVFKVPLVLIYIYGVSRARDHTVISAQNTAVDAAFDPYTIADERKIDSVSCLLANKMKYV